MDDNIQKLDALARRVERDWSRCEARRNRGPACWDAAVNCGAMDHLGNVLDLSRVNHRLLESMIFHSRHTELTEQLIAEQNARQVELFRGIEKELELAGESLARSREIDNSISALGRLLEG